MRIKDKTEDVIKLLDEETTRTNKELLIAAAICTVVGIIIGFFIGKTTAAKNTIKKYNKCYSYDFGDEEE
ncbi:MAG: hypothetical protein NC223_05150 [Butyrivibrio sp.]|nr:hypothetical protein [Butyrivibrio sp.]